MGVYIKYMTVFEYQTTTQNKHAIGFMACFLYAGITLIKFTGSAPKGNLSFTSTPTSLTTS